LKHSVYTFIDFAGDFVSLEIQPLDDNYVFQQIEVAEIGIKTTLCFRVTAGKRVHW